MSQDLNVKVGVGLLVMKGDQILLGKRKGSHGQGQFAGPGGHLEYQETPMQTALRELKEECGEGFKVKNLRLSCVTNLTVYRPKHYLDIGLIADWDSGEALLMEPDKCEGWAWYDIGSPLPGLFSTVRNYVIAFATGQTYFES